MITFTRDWRGYAGGSSVSTLEATIEAIAVAEGAATYGGVTYPPNSGTDRFGNVTSLVDGAGNPADTQSPLFRAAGNANNRILKRFTDTVGFTVANSGTPAVGSIDAASPFGGAAYKVAMPSGNSYSDISITGLNLAGFDGHVMWQIWVEDYTALNSIRPIVSTTGFSRYYEHINLFSANNETRFNGEITVGAGPLLAGNVNTFVAGTDTLDTIRLRITPNAGGANVWVKAVYVAGVGRPTHIITHDDCSVTWRTNVLPYLAEAKLTATFGISTGDIGGNPAFFMTSAQVLEIANAGHQISSHNVTNTAYNDGLAGTQTAAAYTADFVTSQAALSAIVGTRLVSSYHPWVQGKNNAALFSTMGAAGVRIARTAYPGYNFTQLGLGMSTLALKIQATHLLSKAQITAICTAAKTYGLTVVWMAHEVTAAGGVGVETSVATYKHLVNSVAADVRAGAAIHRTMAQFEREIYSDRLAAASLLV